MNKHQAEMSRHNLEFLSEHAANIYTGMQHDLVDELALAGSSLADLALDKKRRQVNWDLMKGFVEELPKAVYYGNLRKYKFNQYGFAVDSEGAAQNILSSVVWVHKSSYGTHYSEPYYNLGQNSRGKLLIGNAIEQPRPQLLVVNPDRKNAKIIQNNQRLSNVSISPTVMRDMFELGHRPDDITHRLIVIEKTAPRPAPVIKLRPLSCVQELEYEDISDQMMADYDVLHNLNRHAILFDKTNVLDGLLSAIQNN